MKSYGQALGLSKKCCSLRRALSSQPIVSLLSLVTVLRYKRLPATQWAADFFRLFKLEFPLDWSRLRLNQYSINYSEFYFLWFKTLSKYGGPFSICN